MKGTVRVYAIQVYSQTTLVKLRRERLKIQVKQLDRKSLSILWKRSMIEEFQKFHFVDFFKPFRYLRQYIINDVHEKCCTYFRFPIFLVGVIAQTYVSNLFFKKIDIVLRKRIAISARIQHTLKSKRWKMWCQFQFSAKCYWVDQWWKIQTLLWQLGSMWLVREEKCENLEHCKSCQNPRFPPNLPKYPQRKQSTENSTHLRNAQDKIWSTIESVLLVEILL